MASKWPSSATGPSPLGSTGPRAGQVKTRTNYQSWSVCSAPWCKVHPYYMPTKQDTNHPQQWSNQACRSQRQSSLLRGIIIHRGTTFFHQCGTSLFLRHLYQGCQGRSFRWWLYRRPPCHPLAHLLHLNVFGRDAQLQGLAGCQILAEPEALLLLNRHLLWYWY